MFKQRIKELAVLIENADLNAYQMSLVTEIFQINAMEQAKAVDALRRSVALTQILVDKPTIH